MTLKVAAAKCEKYDIDEVSEAIKAALKSIGAELPKGKKVLVKPNILGSYLPEEAITTHPVFIEAVCRMLKHNNCEIIVGDSSGFSGSTSKAICASGVKAAAEKYGATAVSFESTKIFQKKTKGKVLKEIALPNLLNEVDYVINLPKLKTHSLMVFTAGVKNLFGLVPGGRKPDYHNQAPTTDEFADLLCDIYAAVKPKLKLTIVDGILGMEGNGPAAGKPKQAGLVIASQDAGALDYIVQDIIGLQSPVVKKLISRKLLDPTKVEFVGELPRVNFRPPNSLIRTDIIPKLIRAYAQKQMTAHPFVREKDCIKCGICAKSCPTKAITLKPYPRFNRRTCIDCYCCHELCPEHAIYLKGSIGRKLLIMMMNIKTKVEKRKSK